MRGHRWTADDLAILTDVLPKEGAAAVMQRLPHRTVDAIRQKAAKLGLKDPTVAPPQALKRAIAPSLHRQIKAWKADGWGDARIAAGLGVCEQAVSNAVMLLRCRDAGGTPARRDASGALLASEVRRLRSMILEGKSNADIALQMAVSHSNVCHHRRRLKAELAAAGKSLSPARPGERYSGRRIDPATLREVERLWLEGFGRKAVAERAGVSGTTAKKVRDQLVASLRSEGRCLPGCDIDGRRHRQVRNKSYLTDAQRAAVVRELRCGRSALAAASICGVGRDTAYRIRRELVAAGEQLICQRGRKGSLVKLQWLPKGKRWIHRYRELQQLHGELEARRIVEGELAAERREAAARPRRRMTFEEQLAAAAAGAKLEIVVPLIRPAPAMTLGGVATGAL